jgi:single-strand DNA-binding protein
MTDLNNVGIIGRLTRDIGEDDFSYINTGTAKLIFSIAVNRSVKHGDDWVDEASFFDVTYWGKPAEGIKQYLGKGKQVAVKGYLKQDRWEKDGQKHSRISIVAESVQLLGSKGDGSGNSGSGEYHKPAFNNGSSFKPKAEEPQQQSFEEQNEFPEDIPF